MSGHVAPSIWTSAWKLSCVRCLVLGVQTWCRTWTFWNLCQLVCPDMWENRTSLWLVSKHLHENYHVSVVLSWVSKHDAEQELSGMCQLVCPNMWENRTSLWLASAGLFRHAENTNFLSIVSGHGFWLSRHYTTNLVF